MGSMWLDFIVISNYPTGFNLLCIKHTLLFNFPAQISSLFIISTGYILVLFLITSE